MFCGGVGHTAKDCPKSSSSAVKTKEIGLLMTESGLRRCGPMCGVREYKAQGLVQSIELRRVRKVRAEYGESYGDRREIWDRQRGTGRSESLGFNLWVVPSLLEPWL